MQGYMHEVECSRPEDIMLILLPIILFCTPPYCFLLFPMLFPIMLTQIYLRLYCNIKDDQHNLIVHPLVCHYKKRKHRHAIKRENLQIIVHDIHSQSK